MSDDTGQNRERSDVDPTEGFEDLENKIYAVLSAAFHRADSAAKAIARLEYDLMLAIAPDITKADDGDAVARESNRDVDRYLFEQLFSTINVLRFTNDILDLIDVGNYKDKIMTALIDQQFNTSGESEKPSSDKTVVGTDMGMMVHKIKQLVERNQRTRRSTSND